MNNLPILLFLLISICSNFSYPTTKKPDLVDIVIAGEFNGDDLDTMIKNIESYADNLNIDMLKKNFYNANCLTQNSYEKEIYFHNCSPVNIDSYKLFLIITRTFTEGLYTPKAKSRFHWRVLKKGYPFY